MGREDLIALRIEKEEMGYALYLDDKKIHHVEKYKIEQAAIPGSAKLTAKLTIEMLVNYP